jgi:hypothetical protein
MNKTTVGGKTSAIKRTPRLRQDTEHALGRSVFMETLHDGAVSEWNASAYRDGNIVWLKQPAGSHSSRRSRPRPDWRRSRIEGYSRG